MPVEDPKEDSDICSTRQYSLNDFELIRVIGRGSYAKVLMVELKKTKRIYAMKVNLSFNVWGSARVCSETV